MAAPRHHPAPMSNTSGFPSDLYGKYKHATEFFLGWLLLARTAGIGAASTGDPSHRNAQGKRGKLKQSVSLTAYQEIVTAIAQVPGSLPPRLLRLWPRALAACQTAITLRARVALFFASPETSNSVENDDSHAHFLTCLRDWLSLLQRTTKPVITIDAMREEHGKLPDFANYYDVLELPDDYFPAEINNSSESTNGRFTSISKPSVPKIKQSFDDDLNLELSFLFMELEELSEAVHDVFSDVKTEKKTLVEASVVARVANDCAASVIARLQLLYPAIRSAQDITTLIRDRVPAERFQELWNKVQEAWNKTPDTPRSIQYVPGSIVVDMLWVSHALQRFVVRMDRVEQSPNSSFVAPRVDDEFGNSSSYNEDDTPQYVWPSMRDENPFVQQQMALLCNELLLSGQKNNPDSFSGWFLDHIDRLITTRTVSLDMVFLCICWFHAVGVLQGDGRLGRTVSLAITHCGDIAERLHVSLAHGNVEHSLYLCRADVENALFYTNMAEDVSVLLRANPLLAGGMLLDCQLFVLNVGSNMLYSNPRFLTFAHMYNALCDRQLLEPIPFIEDVLRLYEPALFAPSRAAAVHGSYYCTHRLSCGVTKPDRNVKPDRHRPPPTRYKPHTYLRLKSPRCGLFDLSHVVCLLKENDFSVLPRDLTAASASWKTLLGAVSDMCSSELFGSRVLARDMLKLSDDIDDVFVLLCDTLGRRDDLERALARDQSGLARKFMFNSELDFAVALPLLLYADCLELDGSIQIPDRISKVIKKVKPYVANAANSDKIRCYCRCAADVISRFFGQREPAELEATYFIFPPTPDWVSIEFGGTLRRTQSQTETTMATFHCLLTMLQQSDTPLRGSELERLKNAIISDPSILGIYSSDPEMELCSILHHAAAGPACDWRLVEWLIQMGALEHQPEHFRNPPTDSGGVAASAGLCNTLAVHSAATAGLPGTVWLLLEAGHFRDLNTVTFHTRESLAHLAVKHDDRDLFYFLAEMRADLRHRDAFGNRVEDLTTDASWKLQIQSIAKEQQRMLAVETELLPKLQQESDAAADQLRDALATQREVEQSRRGRRHGDTAARSSRAVAPSAVIESLVGPVDSTTTDAILASSIAAAPGKTKKKPKKKKRAKKNAAAA